jgi:hypothetical protein
LASKSEKSIKSWNGQKWRVVSKSFYSGMSFFSSCLEIFLNVGQPHSYFEKNNKKYLINGGSRGGYYFFHPTLPLFLFDPPWLYILNRKNLSHIIYVYIYICIFRSISCFSFRDYYKNRIFCKQLYCAFEIISDQPKPKRKDEGFWPLKSKT